MGRNYISVSQETRLQPMSTYLGWHPHLSEYSLLSPLQWVHRRASQKQMKFFWNSHSPLIPQALNTKKEVTLKGYYVSMSSISTKNRSPRRKTSEPSLDHPTCVSEHQAHFN